jgi:hypothetical protein
MTVHLTSRRRCPMCRFAISIPNKELKAFIRKQLKNNPSPQFRNAMIKAMSQPSRRARARRAEATRRAHLASIAQARRAEDHSLAVAYARAQDQLQLLRIQRAQAERRRRALISQALDLEFAQLAQAQATFYGSIRRLPAHPLTANAPAGLYPDDRALFQAVGLYLAR